MATLYLGFMLFDMEDPETEAPASLQLIHGRFSSKEEIAKTRATHPLYARGVPGALDLAVTVTGLRLASPTSHVVHLDIPLTDVVYCASIQSSLLVFATMPGGGTTHKVHVFNFKKDAQAAQSQAQLLTFMRIKSHSKIPSQPPPSRLSESENTLDPAEDDFDVGLILKRTCSNASTRSCSSSVMSSLLPCGLCHGNHGRKTDWIALKTCAHQFHRACLSKWRAQLHNVCPTCKTLISSRTFGLNHVFGFYSEYCPPSDEILRLARDQRDTSAPLTSARVLVGKTHVAVMNAHDSSLLLRPLRFDTFRQSVIVDSFIVLVVAVGRGVSHGYILQVFETPFPEEADRVLPAVNGACFKARPAPPLREAQIL